MSRIKRLSKSDQMMRSDGFVTAMEVHEATGLALSAIHKGIEDGRIPGRSLYVSDKYSHKYVDIRAYVSMGLYKGATTIEANLAKLVAAVDAMKGKSVASTPRPTSDS